MNTIGWLLILTAGLIIRAVQRGRVMQIGEDLSDAFLAFTRGDSKELSAVLKRTGEANEPTTADLAIYKVTEAGIASTTAGAVATGKGIGSALDQLQAKANSSLALAVYVRGQKAKGYRWAATGPDYYDCSGLVWRGCQDIGYKGSRFTTTSILNRKHFSRIEARWVRVDDIVLWPGDHMGVYLGGDRYYSARSVASGIGESTISGHSRKAPIYMRYTP